MREILNGKIKEALKREHIAFIEPSLVTSFSNNNRFTHIIFYKKGTKVVFAEFEINWTSNGFRCENYPKDYNDKHPIKESKLLQILLRTLVEETLDLNHRLK